MGSGVELEGWGKGREQERCGLGEGSEEAVVVALSLRILGWRRFCSCKRRMGRR